MTYRNFLLVMMTMMIRCLSKLCASEDVTTNDVIMVETTTTEVEIGILPVEEKFKGIYQETKILDTVEALYKDYFNVTWLGSTNCSEGYFNCGNYCIPNEFVCDGVIDCYDINWQNYDNPFDIEDALDEKNCLVSQCGFKCTPNSTNMIGEAFCVPFRQVCDGRADCTFHLSGRKLTHNQHEDEIGCNNSTR